MCLQRHPVDSFNKELNFWEEFPDYKLHPIIGELWRCNKVNNTLKESSLFMWALALCYDRKSSLYAQPEEDKWEVVSEDLFGDPKLISSAVLTPEDFKKFKLIVGGVRLLIDAFEKSIDTPLGLTLRQLESKLFERTSFIMNSTYTMDEYAETISGKITLRKGTADQLDRMFVNTDKIVSLVQKAMNDFKSSEVAGDIRGGGVESLSDGNKNF